MDKKILVSIAVLLTVISLATILAFTGGVFDSDSLTPVEEVSYGTSIVDADTDDDGLQDGVEVKDANTNPTVPDSDGDGLSDSTEYRYAVTDPLKVDTDEDGLDDKAEIEEYQTNPVKIDSDGDGLGDSEEVQGETNPRRADSDGDGINDGKETKSGLNPASKDTDSDGLGDGREVRDFETSPTKTDSDEDGLIDGREIDAGTAPLTPDTDGDGFTDGIEVDAPIQALESADPLRYDVFVEVDSGYGVELTAEEQRKMQQEYASAPNSNPDGSRGISLHIVMDDQSVDVGSETTADSYFKSGLRDQQFDYKGYGFYHILVVNDVVVDGVERASGVYATNQDGMLVEDYGGSQSACAGGTATHELGHAMGVQHEDFVGVDSDEVPFDSYPSVMNYNAPCDHFGYTSSGEFSDWNEILTTNSHPSMKELTTDDDED